MRSLQNLTGKGRWLQRDQASVISTSHCIRWRNCTSLVFGLHRWKKLTRCISEWNVLATDGKHWCVEDIIDQLLCNWKTIFNGLYSDFFRPPGTKQGNSQPHSRSLTHKCPETTNVYFNIMLQMHFIKHNGHAKSITNYICMQCNFLMTAYRAWEICKWTTGDLATSAIFWE